jgi:O-antigen/teichoic acid export membrane protein
MLSTVLSIRDRLLAGRSAQSRSNLKNGVWGGLDFLVTTGSVFLLIPVLLATLGDELFGVLVIVNTLMGFSGLVSFGLGKATLKYVADYRAKGESQRMDEVVRTTLWVYCATGLIACVGIAAASGWLAESVFGVEPDKQADASAALAVGGVGFLSFLIFEVAESVYRGFESFRQPVIVRSVTRLLTLVGQMALALAGFGLWVLVTLQVGLLLVGGVVLLLSLRRKLMPTLRLRPGVCLATLREVFSYGFYSYISGVFGIVRMNGELLAIGAILGPANLAVYAIAVRVFSQVHALVSRVYGYLFPYVAKLCATGQTRALSRCYDKATFQISLISAGLITPAAVLAYPLLAAWLGEAMAVQAAGIAQVLALRFALFPLSVVNAYFLLGSGLVRVMSVITAVNAVLSLAVTCAAAATFGLWGAAIAQLSVLVPIFINRAVIERRLFGGMNLRRVFGVPLFTILPMLVLYASGAFDRALAFSPMHLLIGSAVGVATVGVVAACQLAAGQWRAVPSGVSADATPGPAAPSRPEPV